MIRLVVFECSVLVPSMGTHEQSFDALGGWSIVRLGPVHYRLSRKGNEQQNIAAVEPFTVDGYAAVYTEEDDAAQARKQQGHDQQEHRNRGPRGKAAKAGGRDRVLEGGQGAKEEALSDGTEDMC